MSETTSEDEVDSVYLTPAQEMGESIKEWLESPNSPDWQLADWLRGYDLPLSSGDDEPYLWLTRGLEKLGMARSENSIFCKRLAGIIDQLPAIAHVGNRPEQVMYNAFMLAACLYCPKCLGQSLLDAYARPGIEGEWMGNDVRHALCTALVENQINQDLRPVWKSMIEGKSTPQLPGDPLDGFTGICKMPLSADKLGEPDVEAILWGLTRIDRYLEGDPQHSQKRELLIDGLNKYHPQLNWSELAEVESVLSGLSRTVTEISHTPDRVKRLFRSIEEIKGKYPSIDWALRAVERAAADQWDRWARGVAVHLLVEAEAALPKESRTHAKQIRDALRGEALVAVDEISVQVDSQTEEGGLLRDIKARIEGNADFDRNDLQPFVPSLYAALAQIQASMPSLRDSINLLINICEPSLAQFV